MLTNHQWGVVAISREMLKISVLEMSLKITNLRLQPHLLGSNKLNEGRGVGILHVYLQVAGSSHQNNNT